MIRLVWGGRKARNNPVPPPRSRINENSFNDIRELMY
jgi:hypothetical protein